MTKKKSDGIAVEGFSKSRVLSFLECPRVEYYRYRAAGVGVEPTTPIEPFIEGEFMHYALEHWYRSGKMLRQNMINRIDKLIDGMGAIDIAVANRLRVKLAALIGAAHGYKAHYANDLKDWKIVLVEEPFEIEIGGVKIVGIIDLVVDDKDGRRMLVEHKCVAQVDEKSYQSLPMDLQGLLYCLGVERLTGAMPQLKMWNYIIKSRLRPKGKDNIQLEPMAQFEARVTQQYIDEPQDKFFRSSPIIVVPDMVLKVKEHFERMVLMMQEARGKEPLMNFASCSGKYGMPCMFVPACTEYLSGKEDGWNAPSCRGLYRRKKILNPELGKEDEVAEKK